MNEQCDDVGGRLRTPASSGLSLLWGGSGDPTRQGHKG
jgi:hypothetical protein